MSSSHISHFTSGGGFSPSAKIYVAGHRGLVGSAIVRKLLESGLSPQSLVLRTSSELDLRQQAAVEEFFAEEKPEYVFLAAARVGGILANSSYPADFIRDNVQIQTNVIDAAYRHGVKKLLFLGSSCIYPKMAPQPLKEEHLLTGPLEPTNEWYAIAKIAGIKMCQAYRRQYGFDTICVMPTNLYGSNDNFDLETSHVLPAMIRKFHLAKLATAGDVESIATDEARNGRIPDDVLKNLGIERTQDSGLRFIHAQSSALSPQSCPKVILWGTGSPRREFLHVDDLADACLFLMGTGLSDEGLRTKDSVPSPHPSVLIPHPSVLSPQPSVLSPHPSVLIPHPSSHLFNIGVGLDITIRDLAGLVQEIVGFDGEVVWDSSKPDGTPQKLLDVSRLKAQGWEAGIDLQDGIKSAYAAYLADM